MNHDVPLLEAYRRVSRSTPCPICAKSDWCLVARDGSAAICQRVESARRCGEAGWLHRLCEVSRPARRPAKRVRVVRAELPPPDLSDLAVRCRACVEPGRLQVFARGLGVSVEALLRLGIGWSAAHSAWAFPMTDAAGRVRGIRLRTPAGGKFSVPGSKEGLFLPSGDVGGPLLIPEGPTDAAALLDLGFSNVAGRPSCTGGVKLLAELARCRQVADVVIFADADGPGRQGAANLASVLAVYAPAVRVIEPPAGLKDARDWLRAGGTHDEVELYMAAAPAIRLAIHARRADRDA
jgi:hypothetical protein